jgi:hypothetical protein
MLPVAGWLTNARLSLVPLAVLTPRPLPVTEKDVEELTVTVDVPLPISVVVQYQNGWAGAGYIKPDGFVQNNDIGAP